ncbi:amidohydrolase [Microbacterium koreense]|uniref:Amidohydrolase n=1 Tax=Microbacterium koreense TaxID=323761 RepID=A0ABW2ZQM0_9MICO
MDAVYTNAKITTSDAARPFADTVVVENGRFTYVGDRAGAPPAPELTVHDLGGRRVLPGLIDAHTHPEKLTLSRWHVQLPPTDDLDEVLDFIAEYALSHPREEAPFLYFEYYSNAIFGEGAPTREILDRVVNDRPVLCQDFSDHASWVNTRMLELLGVTRDTPDPTPGLEVFVRDENGAPTGHVLELAYLHFVERVWKAIGWHPPVATPDTLSVFFERLRGWGVTAVFEAYVEDEATVAAVAELDRTGGLGLHYEGAVRFRSRADVDEAVSTVRRYQQTYGSERVRFRTVKIFLDGTNEMGSGAVLQPLVDGTHGEMEVGTEELAACLMILNDAGIDAHIHLVGDRAFRSACDAVQAAREELGAAWRMRVTLAHCELVDPSDMPRPADLGVMVNWTPHWSGGYFGEGARDHLGDERWNRMYDFTDIADAGATLTFGSDVVTASEENRADPFLGMQAALTRVDPEFPLDPARFPASVRPREEARIALERLIQGYTIDAARQLRLEDRIGSIAPGKLADFVVLSEDLFDVPPDAVGSIDPLAVFIEGEIVSGSLIETR